MSASSNPGNAHNQMRKIIVVVGVAILVFLAFTSYSVQKSLQSERDISAVKDLYFPVLQGIEANIVRIDKMEELFLRSVMTGDRDALDEAVTFHADANKTFDDIAKTYPARASEVARLREDLAQYNEKARRSAEAFLKTREGDLEAQRLLTQQLGELRKAVAGFREASYGSFVQTLAQTQRSVQTNLYMGIALGLMNLCFMGVLVYFIRRNVTMMAIIAQQNATLEMRVSERTAQLKQKTQDVQAMLQNMPQGVLTLERNGSIHPEYSAYLETIFETKDIAGRPLMDLAFSRTNLGADEVSQVDAAIGSCIGEDQMNFTFNEHLLVTELQKHMEDGRTKSLELSWSPICDDDGLVEKLMVCVRDVTELKRLAAAANAQKRELEIIGEVLSVSQEKFQEFIRSAGDLLQDNESLIGTTPGKDLAAIGVLFRNMHTVKGNARTYGLKHLTNAVHLAEQVYDQLRSDETAEWNPQGLIAQLRSVMSMLDEYQHINDNTLGRKGPGRRGSVERFLMVDKEQISRSLASIRAVDTADLTAMKSALLELDQTLDLIGTEPLQQILSGIIESMPSLAKELGKEPPVVAINDRGIAIRTQASGLLKNVFTHLFRNSMDHGLESADERRAKGKSSSGRIEVFASIDGERLTLSLSDDGRGLAVERIRQKAIASGLLEQGVKMSDLDVAQLIFASGFSTADHVTEVSGRGVGMDAVKGFLAREGGDVEIRFRDAESSTTNRPFELRISLPSKFAAAVSA